jgi:hypothetical protein
MSSSEDTPWEEIEDPAATDTLLDKGGGPTDSRGGDTQTRADVQSNAALSDQKEKTSSSTASERPALDPRLTASFKVVHKRRDRLIGRRVNYVNQRTENEYQRNAFTASTQRVFNAVDQLMSRYGVETSSSPEFHALQEAVQEAVELGRVLGGMELKLQEATRNLIAKESELHRKEKTVYKRLARLTRSTHQSPSIREKQPKSVRSASSKSTARTHPRARKYYDRAGEVKILRERIHNMQVQHRQDLASRQMQREAGHIVKVPERLFQGRFYTKLGALLQELETTKKDAFLLKLACQRQGIVLEDDTESQNNEGIIDASLEDDRRILSNLASQQNGQNKSLLLGQLLSEYMDSTTKIRRWLHGMPPDLQAMDPGLTDAHIPHKNDTKTDTGHIVTFSDQLLSPAANTEAHKSIEERVNPGFLVAESRRASAFGDVNVSDGHAASDLSGEPPSSSDREFSEPDFGGEAPSRRYSDPSPTRPLLLGYDGLHIRSYVSLTSLHPRRTGSLQDYGTG